MRVYFWFKLLLGLSIILLLSCGDIPTCLDIETSLVKIKFIDESGADKMITILSLGAIDNQPGFPEYDSATVTNLSLPLNPGAQVTTFILEQENVTDTLALAYLAEAILISPECGLDAAFSNLNIASTTYGNTRLVNSSIHETVTVNIEITL